jgi:uncharacterized protein DUF5403
VATVDPKVAALVAHMPEIHVAVLAERDKLAGIARGLFASHDNPGGHSITTQSEKVDGLVSLEGPAPLSVEFGHWTKDHKTHVEGLHILGRTIAAASA